MSRRYTTKADNWQRESDDIVLSRCHDDRNFLENTYHSFARRHEEENNFNNSNLIRLMFCLAGYLFFLSSCSIAIKEYTAPVMKHTISVANPSVTRVRPLFGELSLKLVISVTH